MNTSDNKNMVIGYTSVENLQCKKTYNSRVGNICNRFCYVLGEYFSDI